MVAACLALRAWEELVSKQRRHQRAQRQARVLACRFGHCTPQNRTSKLESSQECGMHSVCASNVAPRFRSWSSRCLRRTRPEVRWRAKCEGLECPERGVAARSWLPRRRRRVVIRSTCAANVGLLCTAVAIPMRCKAKYGKKPRVVR